MIPYIQSGSQDLTDDTAALLRAVHSDFVESMRESAGAPASPVTTCPACRSRLIAADGPAVCAVCATSPTAPACTVCAGGHSAQQCPLVLARLFGGGGSELEIGGTNAGRAIYRQWHKDPRRFVAALRQLERAAWTPLAVAYAAYRGDTTAIATLTIWGMACDGTAQLPERARA
jgi:hypothetical protein